MTRAETKKRGRRERARTIGGAGILFEDRDVLVLDKPAGMLAVPIPGSRARNLKDLVDARLAPLGQRAGVVHRIDRYTSGVMVFAKNPAARTALVDQFRALTPERVYWALVRGRVDPAEGELRHALKRVPRGFRQVVASSRDPEGRQAVSRYRVLAFLAGATFLEVRLVTGLKNQIRIQLLAAGHPLVGDRHYAPAEKREGSIDRQALHARSLGFRHPRTRASVRFEAPLPADLRRLLRTHGLPGDPDPGPRAAQPRAGGEEAPVPPARRSGPGTPPRRRRDPGAAPTGGSEGSARRRGRAPRKPSPVR